MAKIDKKKDRIREQIRILGDEMNSALTKKTSNVREINVPEHTRKIAKLIDELKSLK